MKIQIKNAHFVDYGTRSEVAKFISGIVNSGMIGEFNAYTPTEGDSTKWILDHAGCWTLTFDETVTDQVEFTCSYNNDINRAEAALAGWLAYRLNAKIIK